MRGKLGLAGWQWLFLIEALPAIVLSVVVWRLLPNTPDDAHWLEPAERLALDHELARDPVRMHEAASLLPGAEPASGLSRALKSGRAWAIGLFFFCTLGSNYALSFSLPIILKDVTGGTVGQVGWIVAGVGVFGAITMLVNGWHSDSTGERTWHIVLPAIVMGAALLAAGLHLAGWSAVIALTIGTGAFFAMQGPLLGLPTMILSGEAAAVAIAILTMCGVAGGFVGPYWTGWMRDLTGGYGVAIGALCIPCWLGAIMMIRLMRNIAASEPAQS
jgi:ACS family tartrate transporter-like MFS transporter